jgi:hypothetical protein
MVDAAPPSGRAGLNGDESGAPRCTV